MEHVIPFNTEAQNEYDIIKGKSKQNEKFIMFNLKHFIICSSFLSIIIMTLISSLALSINAVYNQQSIISNLKNQIEKDKTLYLEQIEQLNKNYNKMKNCDDNSNKHNVKSVLSPSPFLIHEFVFDPKKGALIDTINNIISNNYSKVELVYEGRTNGADYLNKINHNSIVIITIEDGKRFALCPKSDIRRNHFLKGEVFEIKNRRVIQSNITMKLKSGFMSHSQSYITNTNQTKEYFKVKNIKIYKRKV